MDGSDTTGIRRRRRLWRRRVWLASIPRSGNTLLRCILHHCFGLPSTSVYGAGDLGHNRELERHAGHFVKGSPPPEFTRDKPLLVKTHRWPSDARPAIYVVRDGRAATVSLWEFKRPKRQLREVIVGPPRTWASHLAAWRPWERPDTLLLRYEDMVAQRAAVLARISAFLDAPVLSHDLPDRAELAAVGDRWIRAYGDWRCKMDEEDLRLFNALNGDMMGWPGSATGPSATRRPGPSDRRARVRPVPPADSARRAGNARPRLGTRCRIQCQSSRGCALSHRRSSPSAEGVAARAMRPATSAPNSPCSMRSRTR